MQSITVKTAQQTHIGGSALSIPAVAGIMSHLIGQMLSEAQPLGVHTDFGHEQVDASHEVAQCLIGDQFLTRKRKGKGGVNAENMCRNTTAVSKQEDNLNLNIYSME